MSDNAGLTGGVSVVQGYATVWPVGSVNRIGICDWSDPLVASALGQTTYTQIAIIPREHYEALVAERDRYRDALLARHGGEPIALLDELDDARAKLAASEQKVAELEKNAARYGAYRSNPDKFFFGGRWSKELLDAAIDAALNQERSDV